jgi:molybdate transport system substrate-binding protein
MKRLLVILTLTLLAAVRLPAATLNIFAAASLTDVLKELAPAYESATGDKLAFNFAGSNVLARQIQEGAPADVFFSADELKMNALQKAGLIDTSTEKALLSNTLVIVIPTDSKLEIPNPQALASPEVKRIALADPAAVPAGIYSKEYLEKLNLWEKVKDRVIPTENVRAALAAVESGNVNAGIVYKTDAGISKTVKIAYEVPAAEGPKITYPIAVLKDSKNAPEAAKFVEFLESDTAKIAFKKYGFLVE